MEKKILKLEVDKLTRLIVDGEPVKNPSYPDSFLYPVKVGTESCYLSASPGMLDKIKELKPVFGMMFAVKKQAMQGNKNLPTLVFNASGDEVKGSGKSGGHQSKGMSPETQANIEAQWAVGNAVTLINTAKDFWVDMKQLEKNQLIEEVAKKLWQHKQSIFNYILKARNEK